MPAKKIEQPKTAAEQLNALKAKAEEAMPDEARAELDRMRGEAKAMRGDTSGSVGVPTLDVTAPVFPSFLQTDEVEIEIFDGRILVMAPPTVPEQLVVAEVFKEFAVTDSVQLEAQMRMARIFQYIRRIGNQQLPGFIASWPDIVKLAHSLGSLGTRAVYECYQMHWPDHTQTSWKIVRKSSSNPISSKQ